MASRWRARAVTIAVWLQSSCSLLTGKTGDLISNMPGVLDSRKAVSMRPGQKEQRPEVQELCTPFDLEQSHEHLDLSLPPLDCKFLEDRVLWLP